MKKDKFSENEQFPTLDILKVRINEMFGDKISNIEMSNSTLNFDINDDTYIISKNDFSSDNRHYLVCDECNVFISDIWYLNRIQNYLTFISKELT